MRARHGRGRLAQGTVSIRADLIGDVVFDPERYREQGAARSAI